MRLVKHVRNAAVPRFAVAGRAPAAPRAARAAGGITRARDRERADLPRELGERGAEAGGPVLTAERALSSDDRTCTVCPT